MAQCCRGVAVMLSVYLCTSLLLAAGAEITSLKEPNVGNATVNATAVLIPSKIADPSTNNTKTPTVITSNSTTITTPAVITDNSTVAASTVPAPVVNATVVSPNSTVSTSKTNATKPENATIPTLSTPSPIVNKTDATVTTPIASNMTAVNKNLGENGTGIRKNDCDYAKKMNSTAKCVSDPISSSEDSYNIDDFSLNPEQMFNDHNATLHMETHSYYDSGFVTDKKTFAEYWKMLMNSGTAVTHPILSKSYGKSSATTLSFYFPFYGHLINHIKIATGGFVYVGDLTNDLISRTQFIAPLMANFDPRLRNDSFVKHIDNGTAYTVIWENVVYADMKNNSFTFAVTLHRNGNIVFAYKNVTIPITSLNATAHPVNVGICDAYLIEHSIRVYSIVQQKLYEYHRINFKSHPILNDTLIYLTPLPTCKSYDTCNSCLNQNTSFQCSWCASANRCSDGYDRLHQDWLDKNCFANNFTTANQCIKRVEVEGTSATTIANIFISLIVISAVIAWFVYAYRNPHTYSGQLLIKYRPSQWSWRRGEARYTAATIHM